VAAIATGCWNLLVLAAGLTAIACAFLLRSRPAWNQVGPPRDNPCHQTGRKMVAGLIPISIATVVCLLSVAFHRENLAVLAGVVGLGIVGHLDDRRRYTAGGKLVAQLPFFLVLLLAEPFWAAAGHPWLLVGLAFFVVVTNGLNVIDVADGLAPGVSALTLGALGFILFDHGKSDLAIVAFCFAGATCGFLLFNAAPGRLILGDGGSLPLGGLIAALVPQVVAEDVSLGVPIAALLVSAPLFEVSWVSIRRMAHRIPPWVASPDHVAYWLVGRGMPASHAVGWMVACHGAAVAVALWLAGVLAGIFWVVFLLAVLATTTWIKSRWQVA